MVDWFLDKFGVDYRGTSLFCTGDHSIAAGYKTASSTVVQLEPVDEYCVCFSTKCKDLFGHYQFNWTGPHMTLPQILSDMESLDFTHQKNGGLELAASSGHEVMLVAERFRYQIV